MIRNTELKNAHDKLQTGFAAQVAFVARVCARSSVYAATLTVYYTNQVCVLPPLLLLIFLVSNRSLASTNSVWIMMKGKAKELRMIVLDYRRHIL